MVVGMCELCRSENVELRNSHFLPSALYKVVCQFFEPSDNAPVMINTKDGVAVQTNIEFRKHLLCECCEGKFNRNGENRVVADCLRKDNNFKLRDVLKGITPSHREENRAVYCARDVQGKLDVEAYTYFAASILWRATVTNWPMAPKVTKGCLGAHYQEEFRLYLLGKRSVPERLRLKVNVMFDKEPLPFVSTPVFSREKINSRVMNVHSFYVPGMRFEAFIGGSRGISPPSISWTANEPIFVEWQFRESTAFRNLASDTKNADLKGKLANDDNF